MTVLPPLRIGATLTSSQSIGTYADLSTSSSPINSRAYICGRVNGLDRLADLRPNTCTPRHVMPCTTTEKGSPSPGIKVTVYLPYSTNLRLVSCVVRGSEKTHVRAFLTSEGGGRGGGRSVVTEGLGGYEPSNCTSTVRALTRGALTATRALPERVRDASIFVLSGEDGGEVVRPKVEDGRNHGPHVMDDVLPRGSDQPSWLRPIQPVGAVRRPSSSESESLRVRSRVCPELSRVHTRDVTERFYPNQSDKSYIYAGMIHSE